MFELTPVLLRNLFRGPATRRYPLTVREPFLRTRGELENEIGRCTFCGRCARRCPSRCIEVDPAAGLWRWDPFACLYCGVCVEECPVHGLRQKETGRRPATVRETVLLQGTPRRRRGKEESPSEAASGAASRPEGRV